MQKYQNYILNNAGQPLIGGSVTVYVQNSAAATIYRDNGVNMVANPLITDESGYFEFYAENGTYSLTINGANINALVIDGIVLYDALDINAASFASLVVSGATSLSTLTATGQVSLGGAAGGEGLRVTATPGTVNTLQAAAGTTGNPVALSAIGADAAVGLTISAKGAGSIQFRTGDTVPQASVTHTANAVNTLSMTGAIAGASPVLSAVGAGTDLDVVLTPKGAGALSSIGDVAVDTLGKGLQIKEGLNAKMGVATLVAGTVTVANTAITASSRVFLTAQTTGGTPGALRVSARTPGTSFAITSTSGTDTSQVAYLIMEPA